MANKNTYALITGGSSGIGYEIARDLAARGYNLILISRNEKNLKNCSASLENKYGISVDYILHAIYLIKIQSLRFTKLAKRKTIQ